MQLADSNWSTGNWKLELTYRFANTDVLPLASNVTTS